LRFARSRAAAIAIAVLVTGGATACAPSGSDGIDVARMNEELARVMFQVKHAEGFDYDQIDVVCRSTGGDAVEFTCHVDAANPGKPVNAWNETVTCQPASDVATPRCATDSGYSLQ
jgi:hypothetical protein